VRFRSIALSLAAMGSLLVLSAGPAQASTTTKPSSSDDPFIAQAAFCVPCAYGAAVLAVRIARVIQAARAARLLRAARLALKPPPGAPTLTTRTLTSIRTQSQTIARRGAPWVRRNWEKLPSYVKACISGVATLETGLILKDGKISKEEWQGYVSIRNLGNTNTSYLDLYTNPLFEFDRPTDGWAAACAVAVVGRYTGPK